MHIGHLVPLERSNIVMLLGSSGVVSWSEKSFENVCENANTHAQGVVHLVVLAHLQRRSCLRSLELGEPLEQHRTLHRTLGPCVRCSVAVWRCGVGRIRRTSASDAHYALCSELLMTSTLATSASGARTPLRPMRRTLRAWLAGCIRRTGLCVRCSV